MPRGRRRRTDRQVEELLSGGGALILVLVFFVPGARQALLGVGFGLLILVGLVVVGFLIYGVIRLKDRRDQELFQVKTFDLNAITPEVTVSSLPEGPEWEYELELDG
jgi:hypothetical protein